MTLTEARCCSLAVGVGSMKPKPPSLGGRESTLRRSLGGGWPDKASKSFNHMVASSVVGGLQLMQLERPGCKRRNSTSNTAPWANAA